MSCGLDIGCHLQAAAWEWWAGVGLLNKALIVGGLVLVILSAVRGVVALLHKVGGWPAVIGAVLAILGVVLALLPSRPDQVDPPPPEPPQRSKPEFKFGTDRGKPKRKRKTLLGGLR